MGASLPAMIRWSEGLHGHAINLLEASLIPTQVELRFPVQLGERIADGEERGHLRLAILPHREQSRCLHFDRQHTLPPVPAGFGHGLAVRGIDGPTRPAREL